MEGRGTAGLLLFDAYEEMIDGTIEDELVDNRPLLCELA